MPIERRVKSVASVALPNQKLFVAKDGKRIRALAWGHFPQVRFSKSRGAYSPSKMEADFLKKETARFLTSGGQMERIADYPGPKRQTRAIFSSAKGGKANFLLSLGSFTTQALSARGLQRFKPSRVRSLIQSKKTPLDSLVSHSMTAGAGVLMLNDEFILIPLRSSKVYVYKDLFHVFSGRVMANTRVPHSYESPQVAALREVSDELGVPKNALKFLGHDGIPVKKQNADPFMIARPVETGYYDFLYAMQVRTPDAKLFVRDHFTPTDDGLYVPRKATDGWEHAGVAIVPNKRKAIEEFMKKNSNAISPVLSLVLHGYKNLAR